MGGMNEGVTYIHGFPNARYFEKNADGSTKDGIIPADEFHEKICINVGLFFRIAMAENNVRAKRR